MSIFTLHTRGLHDGKPGVFFYDNLTSALMDADGAQLRFDSDEPAGPRRPLPAPAGRIQRMPAKSSSIKSLKISLGLSCNYSCEYCSQRFVPRAAETNPGDVAAFMAGLGDWFDGGEDGLGRGVRVEFWGGEPLVYIKTLRPLASAIRARYPFADFLVITNGSMLTPEINEWLDTMGFSVGISHDGPGQATRGRDPLQDPQQRANILDLYRRLHPKGRISINAMIHKGNVSRGAVQEFMQSVFGEDVLIGEGAVVDPYDEGGMANSPAVRDRAKFVHQALNDMSDGKTSNFIGVGQKLIGFLESLRDLRSAETLGQKCGMDKPGNVAVNLKGDILTCQNVSAASVAPNGAPHKIGHVSDLASASPAATSTHWIDRPGCVKCPVLQLCRGGCMFLQGPLWEQGCDNAYTDNIAYFIAAFELLLGQTVVKIEAPGMRPERTTPLESRPPARRFIPIYPA